MQLFASDLAQKLQASFLGSDAEFDGVSIDTRTLKPGDLYIALRGEQFDGHDFVKEAVARGAAAVMVSHTMDGLLVPQIVVKNTLDALGQFAFWWRSAATGHVIAVTGSNGKTTVKNCLYSILLASCDGHEKRVLASKGNFNNQIGLPLNVLRLTPEHEYAIFEMGMNHFLEISDLTHIARQNVAVITNAFPAHLEGVGDLAGVAKAKGEILERLPNDGVAILNRDDAFYSYWKGLVKDHRIISFGLNSEADISAVDIVSNATEQAFTLVTPKGRVSIVMSLLGEHNVRNALAAAAASIALDVELSAIQEGLKNVVAEGSRLQVHALPSGAKIIDDAYNANPASTRAAIDHLSTLPGKKILVFADMRELGSNEVQYHVEMGDYAHQKSIDVLLAYGELAQHTVKAFGKNAMHFATKEALIHAVKKEAEQSNVVILAKGSNSMGLQGLVRAVVVEKNGVKL